VSTSSPVAAPQPLPAETHTLILGAGTGGATLAGLLAESATDPVLLLDAGPDYGAFTDRRWPDELLDARSIPLSHDWGLSSGDLYPDRVLDFPRARVIGGCSAHNGCTAAVGARLDYDEWAEAGNPGWGSDDMEPLLDLVRERFRVRPYELHELTPAQAAFVGAGQANGLPLAADLDRLEAGVGIGPMTANVADGIRWNAAFAFLDPVRGLPHLRIAGGALADRLLLDGDRAVGARAIVAGRPQDVHAERVVLCAGAFGSPALLLRSGIGPAAEMKRLGIAPVIDLPGVGRNLLDHPCVQLDFAGSDAFEASRERERWQPDEQAVGRARSSNCDEGPYDIHVFMVAGANSGHPGLPPISLYAGAMRARSHGSVRLRDPRPESMPIIDPQYLTDADHRDRTVLDEARALLREMIAVPELTRLLGKEIPVPDADLAQTVASYCHPAGTCRMGPSTDATAVVDHQGRVHGVDRLHVADASLMPSITRGNINLPTAAIAARIAASLLAEAADSGSTSTSATMT
jgi:choline dehydrogenase